MGMSRMGSMINFKEKPGEQVCLQKVLSCDFKIC